MRRVTTFLSLLLAAGLPGCASSSDCGATAYPHPFGTRFTAFGRGIAGIDDHVARDWELHTHYLAVHWDRYSQREAKAFRQTGHVIADAVPKLGRDAATHWKYLSRTVGSWADRVAEDTGCFPVRFWEGLKMVE